MEAPPRPLRPLIATVTCSAKRSQFCVPTPLKSRRLYTCSWTGTVVAAGGMAVRCCVGSRVCRFGPFMLAIIAHGHDTTILPIAFFRGESLEGCSLQAEMTFEHQRMHVDLPKGRLPIQSGNQFRPIRK